MAEYHFYVYIMASRSLTLYIGFTSDLEVRVWQHKHGLFEGYAKTYQCHRLVHFQCFGEAMTAIAREKQLKRWSRSKKIALIKTMNPAWADLSEEWGKPVKAFREPEPKLGAAGKLRVSPLRRKERASGRDDSIGVYGRTSNGKSKGAADLSAAQDGETVLLRSR